ncbi:hypothetical protein ANN_26432 [Periplaneta americana]|uniref:Uncharacterized protein n=1 Tax=Periplaneta americana TaxID=6978 RepID=A0ABQ8RYB0_PERAM|nr:hypothetical protein ANN_26432 [Periplaneta americana]
MFDYYVSILCPPNSNIMAINFTGDISRIQTQNYFSDIVRIHFSAQNQYAVIRGTPVIVMLYNNYATVGLNLLKCYKEHLISKSSTTVTANVINVACMATKRRVLTLEEKVKVIHQIENGIKKAYMCHFHKNFTYELHVAYIFVYELSLRLRKRNYPFIEDGFSCHGYDLITAEIYTRSRCCIKSCTLLVQLTSHVVQNLSSRHNFGTMSQQKNIPKHVHAVADIEFVVVDNINNHTRNTTDDVLHTPNLAGKISRHTFHLVEAHRLRNTDLQDPKL